MRLAGLFRLESLKLKFTGAMLAGIVDADVLGNIWVVWPCCTGKVLVENCRNREVLGVKC